MINNAHFCSMIGGLHTLLCKESEDDLDTEAAVANDDDEQPEPSMIQGTDALMTVVDMHDNSLAEAAENDE